MNGYISPSLSLPQHTLQPTCVMVSDDAKKYFSKCSRKRYIVHLVTVKLTSNTADRKAKQRRICSHRWYTKNSKDFLFLRKSPEVLVWGLLWALLGMQFAPNPSWMPRILGAFVGHWSTDGWEWVNMESCSQWSNRLAFGILHVSLWGRALKGCLSKSWHCTWLSLPIPLLILWNVLHRKEYET